MASRVLHQFPVSHYCEKTRWHLDRKGLSYSLRNLIPGAHVLVNRRTAGKRTVPVLVDGDRAVADSTEIALYLEERYPDRALLPRDPTVRSEVLALEAFFDDGAGPAVRRWMYGQALAEPGTVRRLFFNGYGPWERLVGKVIGGLLEREIRRMYRIDAAGVAASSVRIDEAVERVEALIQGRPDRYLVGSELTLADVTAASLLAPLVGPPGSPWGELSEAPASVIERRGELRSRIAGRWVMQIYARDRRAAP